MPDISEKLKSLRADLGLSQEAFADKLGVTKSKIQNIEGGKQRVDHEFLTLLAVNYTTDLNEFLTGVVGSASSSANNAVQDYVALPKVDVRASAGPGQPVYSEDEVGRYAVKRSWLDRRGLKPENLSVISVVGDSMVPDLYEEDRIIIDHSQTDMKDTHIYAVRFSGDVFVKRIQRLPDNRALLISKNSDYPPVPVDTDADFKVIGRVVSSMHEW